MFYIPVVFPNFAKIASSLDYTSLRTGCRNGEASLLESLGDRLRQRIKVACNLCESTSS